MSTQVPVILAMWGGMEIPIIVAAAVLLFGAGKIRDLARGLGAAKREFKIGEAEADLAEERLRAQARAQAEANAAAAQTGAVLPSQPAAPSDIPPGTPPLASPPQP